MHRHMEFELKINGLECFEYFESSQKSSRRRTLYSVGNKPHRSRKIRTIRNILVCIRIPLDGDWDHSKSPHDLRVPERFEIFEITSVLFDFRSTKIRNIRIPLDDDSNSVRIPKGDRPGSSRHIRKIQDSKSFRFYSNSVPRRFETFETTARYSNAVASAYYFQSSSSNTTNRLHFRVGQTPFRDGKHNKTLNT